ncbi:MAG: mobile mystery protein A [Bacteroidia bacterium]
MSKKNLQLQQLNKKMALYANVRKAVPPQSGWIKAIRSALGMTMQQLGNKLAVSKQSIQSLEQREKEGTVTLKALHEAAQALDMKLVYGFVPKDGSIDQLIERKARELAVQIVMRTSNTMKLEGQENTKKRIEKAIAERALMIKNELPKTLWD